MSLKSHAFLPPSGAAYWRLCAMWPTMNQRYPELEPSEESMEGEAAHWVWAQMLKKQPVAPGKPAPNGVVVDEEMIEGAETFCMAAHSLGALATTEGDRGPVHVEEMLSPSPSIHEKNYGTPDLWRLKYDLHILEYKYGHGHIAAYENWQCINYAALIFAREGIDGIRDQTLQVSVTVVQPRSYRFDGPVRTWTFVASDLRGHINELKAAADRAMEPNPTATPGTVQCKHCPGRHACPALDLATLDGADHSVARAVPVELGPVAAGREQAKLTYYRDLLNARIDGLEAQNVAFIKAGKRVPGWNLTSEGGRERWKNIDHAKNLGLMFGVQIEKTTLLTPHQVRGLGVPEEVVKEMAERPAGKLKLVPDDTAMIRRVFGQKP